jgi:hypothetical protein
MGELEALSDKVDDLKTAVEEVKKENKLKSFLGVFLKTALALAEVQIPAIALAENAIKGFKQGKNRAKAVSELAIAIPSVFEAVTNKDVLEDEEWKLGVNMTQEGYVHMMNALKKHEVQ